MKIKYGNVENFYKMYNEMQGVSFKVRKIKNGKRVQVHNFTYYIKVFFYRYFYYSLSFDYANL